MKKGAHTFEHCVPAVLIAIVLTAGAMLSALWLPQIPWGWGAALIGVETVLFGVCVIAALTFSKRVSTARLETTLETLLQQKSAARENLDGFYQKLRTRTVLTYAWGIFWIVLALAAHVVCSASRALPINIVGAILCLYILMTEFTWLLPKRSKAPEKENVLRREEFPALYRIADEVFPEPAYRPTILLGPRGSIAVTKEKRGVGILLGAEVGALLTPEEWRAVLWHERCHIDLERDSAELAAKRCQEMPTDRVSVILIASNFAITAPVMRLSYALALSQRVTSAIIEQQADRFAAEHAGAEALAGALAKLEFYEKYERHETAEPFYASETIPTDFAHRDHEWFLRAAKAHQAEWIDQLKHELSARFGSHPGFAERWETIGSPAFAVRFDADAAFDAERGKLLVLYDAVIVKNVSESYDEERRQHYLVPKKIVETYEAAPEDYRTANDLRPVIEAYDELMRDADTIAVCDRALTLAKDESDAAFALFRKGTLLLKRYDTAGIALIRRAAAENHNYSEAGAEAIMNYCIEMGMEKEATENRAFILELGQQMIDEGHDNASELTKKDKLTAEPVLPKELLDEELAEIRSICGDDLLRLYRVTKKLSDTLSATVYIPEFAPETEPEREDECMEQIFNYLDSRDAQYSLFHIDYVRRQGIDLDKIPGAKIYPKQ